MSDILKSHRVFSGVLVIVALGFGTGIARADLAHADLRAALSQARHAIEATDDGVYGAINPRNGQRIRFADEAVTVTPAAGGAAEQPDWRWGLRLLSYGTRDAMQPVARARASVEGQRLSYQRGPVTEWYINRPAGLEQGFDLARPPTSGAEEVVLAMAIDGALEPRWQQPGQSLGFYTAGGDYALSYTKLKVTDADGDVLPAKIALDSERDMLQIVVDTHGADWPILVDPVVLDETKLTALDAAAEDDFGAAVAISGDTALIGAQFDEDAGPNVGAAYVFIRSAGEWSQQQKLIPSGAAFDSAFGRAVALSGDTALIGAPFDDDNAAYDDSGAVYVFTRTGTVWTQQATLFADDAAAYDYFGFSVALSGDTALIGAYGEEDIVSSPTLGAAYVFTGSGATWSQQAKLTASDRAAGDQFGRVVALSGDTALVGAYQDDDAGGSSGSAYVFTRSGSIWTEQQKLTASDAAAGDLFGTSVAVSGDTAVVGAQLDGDTGDTQPVDSGSAYVFTRTGSVWAQQAKLIADDAAANDYFGTAVAVSGDTALVGAYLDDAMGADSGSAYVFTRVAGSWSQFTRLNGSDSASDDYFGIAVALDGNSALVGAPGAFTGGSATDAAYVFLLDTAQTYSLTVTNNGGGSVTSDPAGIDCGADCGETYDAGATVDLTATPDVGYSFSGWSAGICTSVNGTLCTVTMDADKGVQAYFLADSNCAPGPLVIGDGTVFASGTHSRASEVSIETQGSVTLNPGADVTFSAPVHTLGVGFRAAAGSRLTAVVTTPTCGAAAGALDSVMPKADGRARSRRAASRSSAALAAPEFFADAGGLPGAVQEALAALGIDLDRLRESLLDVQGRWIVLETEQSLSRADRNRVSDIYRVDLLDEGVDLVSLTPAGNAGDGPSSYASADVYGEQVVFQSEADDLVEGDGNGASDIFARDLALGETTRLSAADGPSAHPTLAVAGDTLVYDQSDAQGNRQILATLLTAGAAPWTLSLSDDPPGTWLDNHHPAISADGRYVAYLEQPVGMTEAGCQVHLYERETGVYQRQPCPDALSGSAETSRPRFNADASEVHWYLPELAEPVAVILNRLCDCGVRVAR